MKTLEDIYAAGPASKNRAKKAGTLYKGMNSKISKQVVDALYTAEGFIEKTFKSEDWTLNDIVTALCEHFTFDKETVTIGQHKGKDVAPVINSNHLKKYLLARGFELEDSDIPSSPTKEEAKKHREYLQLHKDKILAQRKSGLTQKDLCEKHKVSVYFMTEFLNANPIPR